MVTKTLLETIFPSVIVDNFDIVSIQHYPKDEEIHIHLDEKKTIPVEFSSRRVIFHGFTSAKKIVDDQTGEMVRQGVQDEAEVFQYCAADLHE